MATSCSFSFDMTARSLSRSWPMLFLNHVWTQHKALKERSQLQLLTGMVRATWKTAFRVGNMSSLSSWNTLTVRDRLFLLPSLYDIFCHQEFFCLQLNFVMCSKVFDGLFTEKGLWSWVTSLNSRTRETTVKLMCHLVKAWIKQSMPEIIGCGNLFCFRLGPIEGSWMLFTSHKAMALSNTSAALGPVQSSFRELQTAILYCIAWPKSIISHCRYLWSQWWWGVCETWPACM